MKSSRMHKPLSATSWFVMLLILLMSQHVPVLGKFIALTVIAIPILAGYLLWRRLAKLSPTLMLLYIGATIIVIISFAINSDNDLVSQDSAIYLIYLLVPFAMKISAPYAWRIGAAAGFWRGFRLIMILTSVLGLLQLLLGEHFFSFRDFLPDDFRVMGYNTTNEIVYGVPVYRANGFFFYEPSFFSQFLGLAILIEMRTKRNIGILALFLAAMIASFSGTGLILLGVGLIVMASSSAKVSYREGVITLLPLIVLGLISVYVFPEFFTARLDEFFTVNSSAYIRFVSPYLYIFHSYSSSFGNAIVGVGSGMATSLRNADVMADFSGISKIFFEYGLFGGGFVTFLYLIYCEKAKMVSWIRWPLILVQFFLNNGIFTPITLVFFILISLFATSDCFQRRPFRTFVRGGLVNSDSPLSGNLPQPKP